MGVILQGHFDFCQYPFYFVKHLIIPEPQNAVSLLIQSFCPDAIIISLFLVLAAINLDDEAFLKTDKINNIMIDCLLSAEFKERIH